MTFFFEVLITGLMVGIMYSLVAIGFVLIFKASEIFNMAQGAMSLFAALALVGFLEQYLQLPLWLALICTVAVMTIWAYLVVFVVLKPLVARPPLMLFMATFGVMYLMEGIGQSIYGTQAKGLNLGIPDVPIEVAGIFLSTFDLFFAGVAAFLVIGLVWFFQKTRSGRALRAVSDDHEAA
ncbi:MAG: branched-chain amino acid ABC transporter permease, partial [Desulfobacteraceae bacterium]